MKKTNFDYDLEEQLKDPAFFSRFKRAKKAWDSVLQLGNSRKTKLRIPNAETARAIRAGQRGKVSRASNITQMMAGLNAKN